MIARLLGALGIRSGEGTRVAWLMGHSLFIGVFCAFILTAANALFLDRFEISFLPLAYIAAAIVGYLAAMMFSRLERVLPLPRLFVLNIVILAVVCAAFWYLTATTDNDWVIFSLFVAVGPMFSLIFLGYWGLVVRLFDLRQGKRLFGLVGAGEEVSTIIGLFSIPLLLRYLNGPVPLLLIAAAGLLGCLGVVVAMVRLFRGALADEGGERAHDAARQRVELGDLIKARYFLLMAAVIILLSVAHYIVDFSFLAQIRVKFQGPDQIAQFLGIFFGATKILELLMKVFVSGRLLGQFGLKVGLLVLPVVLAICAGLAIVIGNLGLKAAHFFVLVALSKLLWVVARTSTFLPSFRVLYQPVPRADRLAYQTHVDGTAKELATGLVGLALLGFSSSPSFNALNLFYALVPVLVLWGLVVVRVHRDYRARLMENLVQQMGHAPSTTPVERLMDVLLRLPPRILENSVAVLARVDSTAVVPLLARMTRDGDEPSRVAALRHIEQLKALGATEDVERVAAEDPSPEVRATAQTTLATLREVVALSEDPARVATLAASPLPANRDLAVSAIGFSSNPQAHIGLTSLLWDKDRDVRRAALVAAGRVGNPAYWHRMLSQLSNPGFANAATFGVVTVGEPILVEMDRTFHKAEDRPDVQARILRIYERIDNPRAHELLLSKLADSSRPIRRKALLSLSHCGFRAQGEQATFVANEIENEVRNTLWNMSAVLDIGEDKAVADVRDALESEIADARQALFLLLGLLHDPRAITMVKSNLESGSAEAVVYALEILDLVIEPDIKPLVFPVLEELGYPQALKRLDNIAPRIRLSRLDRLGAIINRDYDRIDTWTRASAIEALAELCGTVAPDLVSNFFHPKPAIREVAARRILALDPGQFDRLREKLPFEAQQQLDLVLDRGGDPGSWDSRSVFGRARVLRQVPAFARLPLESLVGLAASAEERLLRQGHRLPTLREPKGSVYVVLDGELVLADGKAVAGRSRLPRLALVAFGPDAVPIEALQPSRLIRLEPDPLFELAAEHIDLVPTILMAEEQVVGAMPVETAPREAEAAWVERPDVGLSV